MSTGCAALQAALAFKEELSVPPCQPGPAFFARLEQAGASMWLPRQLDRLLTRLEALPGPALQYKRSDATRLEGIRHMMPRVGCSNAACTTVDGDVESALPFKHCSKCIETMYCSSKCQDDAWETHKPRCKDIVKYAGRKQKHGVPRAWG